MSKKSRRQRQRAKQRNYAQLYNQPARPDPVKTTPGTTTDAIPLAPATAPSASVIRLQAAKNADLWDAIIFAGAIFVAFIVIYYVNLRTPILDQFGNFITNLLHFSL